MTTRWITVGAHRYERCWHFRLNESAHGWLAASHNSICSVREHDCMTIWREDVKKISLPQWVPRGHLCNYITEKRSHWSTFWFLFLGKTRSVRAALVSVLVLAVCSIIQLTQPAIRVGATNIPLLHFFSLFFFKFCSGIVSILLMWSKCLSLCDMSLLQN